MFLHSPDGDSLGQPHLRVKLFAGRQFHEGGGRGGGYSAGSAIA